MGTTERGTTAVTKWLAAAGIVIWLALAAWAAVVFLMIASLSVATFFGEPPTGDYWIEGIGFSLAGVLAAAAGPLGVWVLHRRRGWLVASVCAAVITGLVAGYLLVSFGAA